MCFPVNFVKFLRKTFLQNTSGDCFCGSRSFSRLEVVVSQIATHEFQLQPYQYFFSIRMFSWGKLSKILQWVYFSLNKLIWSFTKIHWKYIHFKTKNSVHVSLNGQPNICGFYLLLNLLKLKLQNIFWALFLLFFPFNELTVANKSIIEKTFYIILCNTSDSC